MAVLTPRSSIAIHSKVWYPSPISLSASSKAKAPRRLVNYRRSRISEPCSRVTAQARKRAEWSNRCLVCCSLFGQEHLVQLPTGRRNLRRLAYERHAFSLCYPGRLSDHYHYSSSSSAAGSYSFCPLPTQNTTAHCSRIDINTVCRARGVQ